ncbi:PAS domain-containing protein [Donghicola sp. C2-DW-16]|uniref:PAS domain-containing protein n=1 Tax=Donghicola mangrovi TaxID=2729614 RepID=A0ABX2PGM2_9RHOB|nr:chemotaxis protein CheB [Donghicola mangrovi]NVO28648.1 PAS domain-containing protein [Donghicola mangrovi]
MPDQPLETPIDDAPEEAPPLYIVGIGASAGGLEALQSMVGRIRVGGKMTYVIAQHLSPNYKSMMADLLARETTLKVYEAKDGMPLKADTIYCCPPNKNITIKDQTIRLIDPKTQTHGPKPSINELLMSVAIDAGVHAIGVILSGTGTDGSEGIRAIKAEGGLTFAQDPQTAKYDGMPNSAILTAKVDFVESPDGIVAELEGLIDGSPKLLLKEDSSDEDAIVDKILRRLLEVRNVDFTMYKRNTINRRIERRMTAQKVPTIAAYLELIKKSDDEVSMLYSDILIGVTSFFRDTGAFEALEAELRQYIRTKTERTLRIWVPGCSTGEEPYALAMLLSEILGPEIKRWQIQIFGTDIDDDALETARRGQYPESAAMVTLSNPKYRKYFNVSGDRYLVAKVIRELVIFSRHDLTYDPPFLRLDLISCRNLLIYFSSDLQRRIMPIFHYSLNHNGMLFLGKSESVGSFATHFREIDKRNKIYRANALPQNTPTAALTRPLTISPKRAPVPLSQNTKPSLSALVADEIKRNLFPMSLVLNESNDIVFVGGKNAYINRPDGDVTDNIFQNVHPALSTELRAALQTSVNKKVTVKTPFQQVKLPDGTFKHVRVVVIPMEQAEGADGLKLISFQEEETVGELYGATLTDHSNDERVALLEVELRRSREQVQTVIEELETSNEELQSMNEEMQSANEELQSTNEELETTNEELQSTNEELQTAYSELKKAYDDREVQGQELRDVQARFGTQQKLLTRVQQSARLGLYEWDVISGAYEATAQVRELLGVNDEILLTLDSVKGLMGHNASAEYEHSLREGLKTGAVDILFNTSKLIDGEIRYLRQVGEVEYSKTGIPLKVYGTIQDVTSSEMTRSSLRKVQAGLQAIYGDISAGVFIYDYDLQRNLYINDEYTKLLGYTLEQLNAMPAAEFATLFHPDDAEIIQEHRQNLISSQPGESFALVCRFRHAAGHYVWLHGVNRVLRRKKDGSPKTYLGLFFVIDAAEADEIRGIAVEGDPSLQVGPLPERSDKALVVCDEELNITLISKSFKDEFGYSLEHLLGQPIVNLFGPDDALKVKEAFEKAQTGTEHKFALDVHIRSYGGSVVSAKSRIKALHDSDGHLSSFFFDFSKS